jgi:hypothetical protein
MTVLIKITEKEYLNSKDSFLKSLDLNISNNLIRRIIVFTDSNSLKLKRSKVVVIPNYGPDSHLMSIASSIYPNENMIWSNMFDVSNNKVKVNPKVVKVDKKDRRTVGEKIIPNREVKLKVNPKIDVIIISVNYNDFLLVSLSNNIKYFKNITVVTSSDDLMCQKICDKFKVKCVITERMYEDGSSFNKGKAINEGIKSINNPDWILLMDADIVLSDKLEFTDIDEDTLYTTDRYICNDYNTYKEWMNNNIKLENIGKYESDKGLGFFQLFNINNKNIDIKKPFPEASDNAAWSDLQFRDKFSKRKKVEISTIHLGPDKVNWNGRESVKFITDDEFYNLYIIKSTFTICSYYFNFRNDIRQKNNFIKFLEQFKDHYDNMIVGIVDYGDIDFDIPCESIIVKGDNDNKVWSKEILINKIIDKVDTDYLLWIDGDLIYNNLDWLDNIDKVVGENDFVQLFENINYLGESGELLESHKSLVSSGNENIDNLSGYKPGGSWLGKVPILKEKKLFEKMYVGGGDTIFMCGLLGVKRGVTLSKVKESNGDIYNESIEWIDNFGQYKVGYLSETIDHLYHGDLKDRNYNSRYKRLSRIESIDKVKKTFVFNQFFGIGDILFIEPIMRKYFKEGNKIILPVLNKFLDLQPYFPYINFIDKEEYEIDYEEIKIIKKEDTIILPMRWSREFFNSPLNDTMLNKYKMVGMDLNEFRDLTWLRHRSKEDELMNLLNIKEGDEYNLINMNYHTFIDGKVDIKIDNNIRNIEMRTIEGFTLLDWTRVIEEAKNIHTVNTSILFLLECLDLNADEIHLYSRNVDGRDFDQTNYLWSKKYITHN